MGRNADLVSRHYSGPLAAGPVPRFSLSFAVLVVPTTLMGATLPLAVKSALARGSLIGRQVSLLYAGSSDPILPR